MKKPSLPSTGRRKASGRSQRVSRVLQERIWTHKKEAFLVHKQRHRDNKVHMFSKSKYLPKTGLLGRRKNCKKELRAAVHQNCPKPETT